MPFQAKPFSFLYFNIKNITISFRIKFLYIRVLVRGTWCKSRSRSRSSFFADFYYYINPFPGFSGLFSSTKHHECYSQWLLHQERNGTSLSWCFWFSWVINTTWLSLPMISVVIFIKKSRRLGCKKIHASSCHFNKLVKEGIDTQFVQTEFERYVLLKSTKQSSHD